MFLWGVMALILWQKDQERDSLFQQASHLGSNLSGKQINEVNRKKFIKKVVDENVKLNNFLVKLGTLTQQDVWLEKIQLDATKAPEPVLVQIEGRAINLDQVNRLLSPLNTQLPNSLLEVSNAAPATSLDGQAYFTWSIQNKAAGQTGGAQGSAPPAPSMPPPGAPPGMGGGP
jgi:hypothetical protein